MYQGDVDAQVGRVAAWLIGVVSRPVLSTIAGDSQEPTDLNHLPPTSVVKALFGVLTKAGGGDAKTITPPQVVASLQCLTGIPFMW